MYRTKYPNKAMPHYDMSQHLLILIEMKKHLFSTLVASISLVSIISEIARVAFIAGVAF